MNRTNRDQHALRDRPPDELRRDVKKFHETYELEDVVSINTLQEGAKLGYENVNPNDRSGAMGDSIKGAEQPGFFHQTKGLRAVILTTACAAITQGWQQSSINASSKGWREDIGGGKLKHNDLLAGFIDAAPWLSASVMLETRLGLDITANIPKRRLVKCPATKREYREAACSTPIIHILCGLCAWLRPLQLLGIASCMSDWPRDWPKASIAPVFAAEAAADHLRGQLLTMWQFFDAADIFLGFLTVWIVDHSWRVLLGSAAIPALIMLFLVLLCPESPRYLIRRGNYRSAFGVLCQLRPTELQAARDLFYIHSQLQKEAVLIKGQTARNWRVRRGSTNRTTLEQSPDQAGDDPYLEMVQPSSYLHSVSALWRVPRNRNACIAAFIVMGSQQLCGINVLSFYSSSLYSDIKKPSESPRHRTTAQTPKPTIKDPHKATAVAWLNFGFGLANFLCTLPAFRLIDRFSRRQLLLTSLGGIFFCLVAIGGFYKIDDVTTRVGPVATFTVVLFNVAYGVGAGPIPFTFSAEAFPLSYREVGMSFSVMVNFLGLGLLVLFVPKLTQALGNAELLFLFSGLDVIAFILVFLFVPSASSKYTLEEMNSIFKHGMICHVRWHLSLFRVFRGRERADFEDFCVCKNSE
ncbi:and other transporter-domain-containing protein [Aspergillus taichungensis]|uniref:And other transporter-domain-containing protein n=1 Tax=Aspergillus taichungensis TaxID=482145 RepID=A0A2J5HT96_9EURO|nr:and other transporter-domain-containing protein [Aspergillus taichungensis]